MRLYEGVLVERDRLYYPGTETNGVEEQDVLLERLNTSKAEGKHLAVVDGAFDVPHDNHTWYLREARLRAAKHHFTEEFDAGAQLMKKSPRKKDSTLKKEILNVLFIHGRRGRIELVG